jgi:hypothetical protein
VICFGAIVLPLQGLQISQIVTAATGDSKNVVNFPASAVLVENPVLVPVYPGTAGIFATHCRISAENHSTFPPYCFNDIGIECLIGNGFAVIADCHDNSRYTQILQKQDLL